MNDSKKKIIHKSSGGEGRPRRRSRRKEGRFGAVGRTGAVAMATRWLPWSRPVAMVTLHWFSHLRPRDVISYNCRSLSLPPLLLSLSLLIYLQRLIACDVFLSVVYIYIYIYVCVYYYYYYYDWVDVVLKVFWLKWKQDGGRSFTRVKGHFHIFVETGPSNQRNESDERRNEIRLRKPILNRWMNRWECELSGRPRDGAGAAVVDALMERTLTTAKDKLLWTRLIWYFWLNFSVFVVGFLSWLTPERFTSAREKKTQRLQKKRKRKWKEEKKWRTLYLHLGSNRN